MIDGCLNIVDVGCRWGFEERIHSLNIPFNYWGFDPDKEECARLSASLPSNYRFEPICLGSRTGKCKVFITKEPACSSLYRPNEFYFEHYKQLSGMELTGTSQAKVSRLDKWCKRNSLRHIDYLKLDSQGSELSILKGCGKLLKTVLALDIEVQFNPLYLGAAPFWQVDKLLRKAGLVLYNFETLCHYDTPSSRLTSKSLRVAFDQLDNQVPMGSGQLFWGDAFYVRETLLPANLCQAMPADLVRAKNLFSLLGKQDFLSNLPPKAA